MKKIIDFINGVYQEVKRLTLPSKKETYVTGVGIIIITAFFCALIVTSDYIISLIIKLMLGLGN